MKTNDYTSYPIAENSAVIETENMASAPIGHGVCVLPPASGGTFVATPFPFRSAGHPINTNFKGKAAVMASPVFDRLADFDTPSFLEEEVDHEERERTVWTRWYAHRVPQQTTITPYRDDAGVIASWIKFAKQTASTTIAIVRPEVARDGAVCAVPTRLGEALLDACRAFDPRFLTRHRHHSLNPYARVVLVALCHWCYPPDVPQRGERFSFNGRSCQALLRIARFVRRVCNSRAFKGRLQEEQRLARQNYRSACALVISLFRQYSRLLFVRLDLYYWGEGRAWARTDDAADAFNVFMRRLRRDRIVPGVLACIVRREEGAERGIHFHVAVIFDGHKHKDAYGLAETLGKAWLRRYSGGHGTYFNCYNRQRDYRFNGIGLVHVSDRAKLIGVRVMLTYVTKPEY